MSDFRLRLEEEVNRLGVTAISTRLSVARNTIYNWLGKGNVPLNMLMALGECGVDVTYVTTGQHGSVSAAQDAAVDWHLLEQVIAGVEGFLSDRKAKLRADRKAGLIRVLYLKFSEEEDLNQARFKDFMEAVMATV